MSTFTKGTLGFYSGQMPKTPGESSGLLLFTINADSSFVDSRIGFLLKKSLERAKAGYWHGTQYTMVERPQ